MPRFRFFHVVGLLPRIVSQLLLAASLGIIIPGAVLLSLGPRPSTAGIDRQILRADELRPEAETVDSELVSREEGLAGLRPNGRSRILRDPSIPPGRRPWSILFLHGFAASPEEGREAMERLGRTLGAPVLLWRLSQHGLDAPEVFHDLLPDSLAASAAEGLRLAHALGDRVIVVGSSTGGALALWLAAHRPDKVAALVLWSPLVSFTTLHSKVLGLPWGLQIARLMEGSNTRTPRLQGDDTLVWARRYRLEGLVALHVFLLHAMHDSTLARVKAPALVGWTPHDTIASLVAIRQLTTLLGGKVDTFPVGDAPEHSLAWPRRSWRPNALADTTAAWVVRELGASLASSDNGIFNERPSTVESR